MREVKVGDIIFGTGADIQGIKCKVLEIKLDGCLKLLVLDNSESSIPDNILNDGDLKNGRIINRGTAWINSYKIIIAKTWRERLTR